MTEIAHRIAQVRQQIAGYAQECGRDAQDIQLLAVSKTKPIADILAAYDAGQREFGENYVQEAQGKIEAIDLPGIHWHFIGRIQSNKTATIAGLFSWAHALASAKHAARLSQQRPSGMDDLNLCIQVNLSGEASKEGVSELDLPTLAEQVTSLPRVRLRGLMTMPPAEADEAQQLAIFSRLKFLLTELNRQGHTLDTLSMGMSGDMKAAICAGSTMVRVGTAIFGSRNYGSQA